MSQQLGKAYFRDQLKRDPVVDSDTILALRAASVGTQPNASGADRIVRSPEMVDYVQATIESIRMDFWALDQAEVLARLDTIDQEAFPELATTIRRLNVAAKAKGDFARCKGKFKKNTVFVGYLATIVTSSPQAIGGIKEVVARDMLTAKARQHKRAARRIRSEYPQMYAIDPAWIDSVADGRTFGVPRGGIPVLSRVPFWVWWVLVILLGRLVW